MSDLQFMIFSALLSAAISTIISLAFVACSGIH